MATTHRSAERFKYGICLNDECSLCKSKKVQQIPMRKDLVCTECGKPLRECPPPKSNGLSKPLLIGIIAAAVILIALAVCYFTGVFDGKTEKPAPTPAVPDTTQVAPVPADTTATDTVSAPSNAELEIAKAEAEKAKAEAEKAKAEAEKAKAQAGAANRSTTASTSTSGTSTNGSLTLSYGRYTGAIKNGYPNGQGKLVYTTSRQINKYDTKGRMAQAGDYVQGVFVNGFFTIGKHYNSAGELIESINVGVADDVYDSK